MAQVETQVDHDKINLKLILVSGRVREIQFPPSTSAADVCDYVFNNWPPEWDDEKVTSSSLLKLIYHGRFLHGTVTLSALSLPLEPNSNDSLKKAKRGSNCCRCSIC
uniref:Rad60-SLD_2 domain-containing protein n=1 Tax=Strongyloides stercoralis TaxID=6248 RepID=A0A0K0DZ71_STRER